MLHPVVTSIWNIIPFLGHPSWPGFGFAAVAMSWWYCLPFIVRATWEAMQKRQTMWLAWAGSFWLWACISAVLQAGYRNGAFRYRDSLVPVIMLLAAKGYVASRSDHGKWALFFKFYWRIVVFIIVGRGLGILKL